MTEYYENLEDNEIINLLYGNVSILEEYHLINLHNFVQNLPLIPSVERLILFKNYIKLCEQLILQIPFMKIICPVFVFYSLDNVKCFLKEYYEITEVYNKQQKLIKIKINKKWYEISN